MRYYTKTWYNLLQQTNCTILLAPIPDKPYSDSDIQNFYDQQLSDVIARNQKDYYSNPTLEYLEYKINTEPFDPEDCYVPDYNTGTSVHLDTIEKARAWVEKEKMAMENLPPFDPSETISFFETCYQNSLTSVSSCFPDWVLDLVDKRLLALNLIPESVYQRLKKEEEHNQQLLSQIETAAEEALSQQDIPLELERQFHFHDGTLWSLNQTDSDLELTLARYENHPDESAFVHVLFQNVTDLFIEDGILPIETNSACYYLYEELYLTEEGYEVHMMFTKNNELYYLTIFCENIVINDVPPEH